MEKQMQIKYVIQHDIIELLESKNADDDNQKNNFDKYDVITFLESQFKGDMAMFVDEFEKTFL
jgi:hypothetical protein